MGQGVSKKIPEMTPWVVFWLTGETFVGETEGTSNEKLGRDMK